MKNQRLNSTLTLMIKFGNLINAEKSNGHLNTKSAGVIQAGMPAIYQGLGYILDRQNHLLKVDSETGAASKINKFTERAKITAKAFRGDITVSETIAPGAFLLRTILVSLAQDFSRRYTSTDEIEASIKWCQAAALAFDNLSARPKAKPEFVRGNR
jgi:hypothetical protein